MKSLNWFQVYRLAIRQRRAIRREGWQHWILYRFGLWLVSRIDAQSGQELRTVVTATDFRDSEFLAKDWTEEPWEGGTTPPCTTLPPAVEIPRPLGAGVWTRTDRCGGDGEGGGVLPVIIEPVVTLPAELSLVIRPRQTVVGRPPLLPDGDACWTTPPEEYSLVLAMRLGPNTEPGGVFYAWFSDSGASLTADVAPGAPMVGADLVFGLQNHSGAKYSEEPPGDNWGNSYDGRFVSDEANGGQFRPFPGPGQKVTARADYISPSGKRVSAFASYTFAPPCSGYGDTEPIGGFMVS